MLGYWYNKRLTQQTIIDGWLYTGDLGYFDSIGRLIINGRKELIVTSGGDNISPQKIEDMLKEYLEIEQAVIFGDSKPYLVALVVLSKDFEGVNVNNIIRSINKKLNNVEKIRKFLLVSKPFSYDDGLLTQTLKLKKKKFINFIRRDRSNVQLNFIIRLIPIYKFWYTSGDVDFGLNFRSLVLSLISAKVSLTSPGCIGRNFFLLQYQVSFQLILRNQLILLVYYFLNYKFYV